MTRGLWNRSAETALRAWSAAKVSLLASASKWACHAWERHSRLLLVGDGANWVINEELREVGRIARHLGIVMGHPRWQRHSTGQSVFLGDQFSLLDDRTLRSPHRYGVAYFHGLPGTGVPEFDRCYQQFRRNLPTIERVQVSHRQMRDVIANSGIEPHKVHLIPIGINPDFFAFQTPQSRHLVRKKLDIPQTAVVIGSFQKDGAGWGRGDEPKLIKGPDVFVRVMELLKPRLAELFVLLSGPSRGYVKSQLERIGVPYRHVLLDDYRKVGQLYQALDAYVVASRQEGGPKAVLESMASGVPLIATRVGQATDLVQHGGNAWMANVEDAEGLAHFAEFALTHSAERGRALQAGCATAKENSYQAQIPLWREFFDGFVQIADVREKRSPGAAA